MKLAKTNIRLKNIDYTRNCCIEKINQTGVMSKKNKRVSATFNCIDHFLILVSTVTGHISISAFASSVYMPIGITISAVQLKILCNDSWS